MSIVSAKKIEDMIYVIRGQKVMLDSDLAELYGVDVKRLNEQVKRNLNRFPSDFMFQNNREERDVLRSQFATFENVMRLFTKLRSFLMMEEKLTKKIENLESGTTKLFRVVFERLDSIEGSNLHFKTRKKIGLKKD